MLKVQDVPSSLGFLWLCGKANWIFIENEDYMLRFKDETWLVYVEIHCSACQFDGRCSLVHLNTLSEVIF